MFNTFYTDKINKKIRKYTVLFWFWFKLNTPYTDFSVYIQYIHFNQNHNGIFTECPFLAVYFSIYSTLYSTLIIDILYKINYIVYEYPFLVQIALIFGREPQFFIE
jgi:hypothetical protein